MNDVMSRPARIALHAACLRRTFSLRRTGRLATIRWHVRGIARALFCDWHLSPHAHRVIADMIGDFLLLAYGVIWFACAIIASVCIVLVLAALAGGF